MTRNELARSRRALLAKQAELSTGFHVDGIAVERHADLTDEIQSGAARELAVRGLVWRSTTLCAVAAALGRIEEGSYGICVECDNQISPKRLAAFPWAALCLRCQEAADQEKRPPNRFKAA